MDSPGPRVGGADTLVGRSNEIAFSSHRVWGSAPWREARGNASDLRSFGAGGYREVEAGGRGSRRDRRPWGAAFSGGRQGLPGTDQGRRPITRPNKMVRQRAGVFDKDPVKRRREKNLQRARVRSSRRTRFRRRMDALPLRSSWGLGLDEKTGERLLSAFSYADPAGSLSVFRAGNILVVFDRCKLGRRRIARSRRFIQHPTCVTTHSRIRLAARPSGDPLELRDPGNLGRGD